MGVRFPSVATGVVANPLPANATETVVCITPPFTPPLDSGVMFVYGFFALTAGTGTTSVSLALRRGTTVAAVAILSPTVHTLAAGASALLSCFATDNVQGQSGVQYCLTAIQTGATVAGVINALTVLVYAL